MAASTTGEPDTAPSGVNPCDGALFVNLPAENEPQVGYAVNEMLCFISNKMDVMTQDLLVKLCTDFYGKGVIDNAKKLVYAKCNALNLDIVLPRFVKRQGPKKKHSDVLDIIGLCHEVGSKLPIFVARDLSNMPPVSANSFDVASLMRDIEDMKLQLLGLADMSRLSREINDAVNSITNVRPVERAPAEVDQSPIDDGSHPSEKTCRVIDVGSRPSVKTCRVIDVGSRLIDSMRISRAKFKYLLRKCRREEATIRADILASDLSNNDSALFWKHVSRQNNGLLKLADTVGGATGHAAIASMWNGHYSQLFNCVKGDRHKSDVLARRH